jgi:hypothetical protein
VLAVGLAAATTEVEDIDGGPTWGCSRQVQQQPPLKLKMSMADPQDVLEVPELMIREHSACGAHPLGKAVNDCRNLGTNAQRVVRTYFTLTQVGHFC